MVVWGASVVFLSVLKPPRRVLDFTHLDQTTLGRPTRTVKPVPVLNSSPAPRWAEWHSSSPVHRHTVLLCWYWGPAYSGIVRLCSKSSRQCSLSYLLTYSKAKNNYRPPGHITSHTGYPTHRPERSRARGVVAPRPSALGGAARAPASAHTVPRPYTRVSSLTCSSHTTVTAPRIGGTRGAS